MDSACFQVRSIKKKGKYAKYSAEVHNVYEKDMEITC